MLDFRLEVTLLVLDYVCGSLSLSPSLWSLLGQSNRKLQAEVVYIGSFSHTHWLMFFNSVGNVKLADGEVFIGYHSDIAASTILMSWESLLTEGQDLTAELKEEVIVYNYLWFGQSKQIHNAIYSYIWNIKTNKRQAESPVLPCMNSVTTCKCVKLFCLGLTHMVDWALKIK